MMIPLANITDGPTIRRVRPSSTADAALTESIRAHGVLTPIVLRPHAEMTTDGQSPPGSNEPRWEVVIGSRRWRCAIDAGLTEIPAEVREMTDAEARLAQMAFLGTGEPLHAVDQWRTVRQMMVDDGLTAAQAATAMGLDERHVRMMDQVSKLPASLLALCEIQVPDRNQIRAILRASVRDQQMLGQAPDAIYQEDGQDRVQWSLIAGRAKAPDRMYRADAIFDAETSGLSWEEDLFEQEGARRQWHTTDCDRFLLLQREALATSIEGKKRHRIVEPANYTPKLPSGFQNAWGNREKLRAHEWALGCVRDSGEIAWTTAFDTKAQAEAAKKKAAKKAVAGDDGVTDDDPETSADTDDDTDGDTPEAPPPVLEKVGITKTGMDIVHAGKTAALRDTFREMDHDPHDLLIMFILAAAATNVRMGQFLNAHGLAAQLIKRDGNLESPDEDYIRRMASRVLAGTLSIGVSSGFHNSHSGPAAEWIGRMINAEAYLPRFDTETFLNECSKPVLEECATAAGIKWSGKVSDMRARLVGQAEAWRPKASQFGAPGPLPYARVEDGDDD